MAGQAISTIDSSKAFVPTIACQKTANLLELIAQPSSSGDIGALRISRDTDLNGTYDQTLTLPMPVSGVCANGIVSCQPGTWAQCRSFQWKAARGALSLGEVELKDLAGCYCINNSCGANLAWGNMASVLKDLGGGVIGAITTADPRLGVAQALIDGPVIRYTGAQTTSCTNNPAVTGTAYRSNPTAIQGDAFAASRTSQVFQTLAASPAGAGSAQQRRRCTVSREITIKEVTIDDVIARTAGGVAAYSDGASGVDFVLGSPTTHSLRSSGCRLFDFRMTLTVGDPDRLRAVTLPLLSADDWAQLRIDGQLVTAGPASWTGSGLPPGKCERDGTTTFTPNTDLKPYLAKGSHEIWLRIAVADKGNGYAQIHAEVDTSCLTSERVVDLCAGYAGDAKCQLAEESVDGVEIFRSGVATGLKPLPMTRLFGTGACTLQLTRDFFERERTYLCQTDSSGQAQPDLSRGAYIIDHSTETMLADRITTADGTAQTPTRAFALPDRGSVAACEPVCKTRARTANTAVAPAGVVGSNQNDPAGWDTFYHACDDANSCPLGPGEELVSACGCLDDFPEAVVMMQTVRLGGADLVCTGAAR
ncbi:hypothetical protein [Novosphingobium sp. G106]|uniref:hypothetical protein n=1 Tax=Novosphingobium sp. G106 TaxID=2849500 RepID=UPI0020C1F82F|nr:hypothetical protein [Novosphingobium sp. G106]